MEGTLSPSISAPGIEAESVPSRVEKRTRRAVPFWTVIALVFLALVAALLVEARTSGLQARLFSAVDGGMNVRVESGPTTVLRAPEVGPYDLRLGYARMPSFLSRLDKAGFRIDSQARSSPRLQQVVSFGLFPIYREKAQAGLRVEDRAGNVIYGVQYPEQIYESFEAIPPAIVSALLFIEDRQLLDERRPYLNPAINWARLGRAMMVDTLVHVGQEGRVIGASTLATQIEKFRHSPEGRTSSAREKLRQMLSASLRAYQGGPRTLPARRLIAVDYLNSVPLAATADRGEVHGLDDGLRAWFGADLEQVNAALAETAPHVSGAHAKAYKRVLSLILAARRPSFYLVEDRKALEEFTESYLRVLAAAGVIDPELRDAALAQRLDFRTKSASTVDFTERKGVNLVRSRLSALLGVPALYDLDRLDLNAHTTLSEPAQESVTRTLRSLREPAVVRQLGLTGFHLLDDRGDPAKVIYSFTLYERTPRANIVRVQTDSLDQPLDLNAGARLDLGSSAKLRTLITYLEVVAALHARFAALGAEELKAVEPHKRDHLTAWAVDYLAHTKDKGLPAMLQAAMDRKYSASPGEFMTGGGLQVFHNFEPEEDTRIMTVREGFRLSVNLVFIRLLRDVVTYYLYREPQSIGRIVEDPTDPRREAYLTRFADREGSEYMRQFYKKYQGKTSAEALDLLLGGVRPTPYRLATALRSVNPDAGVDALAALLAARTPEQHLSDEDVQRLYDKYAPDAFSLMDRGYLARVHPLELWLLDYLRTHPSASLSEVLQASAAERQEVYHWLFRASRRYAQDKRISSLLEMEAFLEIQKGWERLGYPFASMTPSLASAVGASGDRPAALAELMGIIVNDGVRYPTVLVDRVELAADTPWETRASQAGSTGQAVLAPQIAAAIRPVLAEVVTQGTARGLVEFLNKGGGRHVVGGKTGTGDHRFDTYAPGRRLIESRVVNRAATFVFHVDDRFFGVVTAWVPGREAARYQFTSALPVKLLGTLLPALGPVLDAPPPAAAKTAQAAPGR